MIENSCLCFCCCFFFVVAFFVVVLHDNIPLFRWLALYLFLSRFLATFSCCSFIFSLKSFFFHNRIVFGYHMFFFSLFFVMLLHICTHTYVECACFCWCCIIIFSPKFKLQTTSKWKWCLNRLQAFKHTWRDIVHRASCDVSSLPCHTDKKWTRKYNSANLNFHLNELIIFYFSLVSAKTLSTCSLHVHFAWWPNCLHDRPYPHYIQFIE